MPDDPSVLSLNGAPLPETNGHSEANGHAILAQALPVHEAPAPESASATKFLRGPLKYEVETSAPQIEAGKSFSVYVRVTNPYESPVTLVGISLPIPAEFRDKDQQDASVMDAMKAGFRQELRARILEAQNVAPQSTPGAESDEIVLQHGNSALKRFTLKTWRSTLFMPAAYNLEFQVQYKIDGVLNQDTIRQQLSIRAPLGAVLRGSFCGAIVGSLLHTLYKLQGSAAPLTDLHPWIGFALQTVAGVLLGAVLVVAFARKKDAQPFISIEDFYGGFFVGFAAGYVGQSLLQNILPH